MMHPRSEIVDAAEQSLRLAMIEATTDLTTAETIRVVTAVLSDKLLGIAKYAIREERHGDPNKPGDRA